MTPRDRGCPHCGGSRTSPYGNGDEWEFQGERFSLLTCESCDGVFTVPTPSPGLIAWLYGASFNYRWYRHHYPAKFLDCLLRLVTYRRRRFVTGSRLLDYGGGVGYMARAARWMGLQCAVWDPYANRDSGDVPRGPLDAVFCHHTLEHAVDPEAMLLDIRRVLQAGSRLVIAVPNAGGRGYRERGVEWVWFQPPLLHLHHFTAEGLHALLARTGFAVLDTSFHDRWDASTPADLAMRRVFRKLDGAWSTSPVPWVTAQFTSFARFLALLIGQMGPRGAARERAEILVVAEALPAAGEGAK